MVQVIERKYGRGEISVRRLTPWLVPVALVIGVAAGVWGLLADAAFMDGAEAN